MGVRRLRLPAPQVLAGKAEGGLVHRVHRGVDKALQVGGGGVPRHHRRAEGVHRGLNEHVGNRENGALNSRRQAHPGNLQQLGAVDFQLFQADPVGAVGVHQAQQHQHGGNALGDHRGDATPARQCPPQ